MFTAWLLRLGDILVPTGLVIIVCRDDWTEKDIMPTVKDRWVMVLKLAASMRIFVQLHMCNFASWDDQTNKSTILPLCPRRQIADSWIQFYLGSDAAWRWTQSGSAAQGCNHETAGDNDRTEWQSGKLYESTIRPCHSSFYFLEKYQRTLLVHVCITIWKLPIPSLRLRVSNIRRRHTSQDVCSLISSAKTQSSSGFQSSQRALWLWQTWKYQTSTAIK